MSGGMIDDAAPAVCNSVIFEDAGPSSPSGLAVSCGALAFSRRAPASPGTFESRRAVKRSPNAIRLTRTASRDRSAHRFGPRRDNSTRGQALMARDYKLAARRDNSHFPRAGIVSSKSLNDRDSRFRPECENIAKS